MRRLGLWCVASLLLALAATPARAEVVHLANGRAAGVTLAQGVSPSAIPGAVARARGASMTATTSTPVSWQGGPVVHASAPYLLLWLPSGQSLPSGMQSLLTRYLTDVSSASGTSANVYGVGRQYTDATGFADYRQTFSGSQVIVDTNAYPARDRTNCPSVSASYPTCITDSQLESEVARVIAANHLPTDGPSNSEALPATAPIYFVVLPTDVNVCTPWGNPVSCANSSSDGFCAYHSSFTSASNSVLYATIPTLIVGAGQTPKSCQYDDNPAVQEPNGLSADVVLKYLSHEDNETITDPFLDAWYDDTSGNEIGDNCNAWGTNDPAAGTSPNAFTPVLGGSATGSPNGTLYNQLINSDRYYLQSEWSNGDGACELRPSAAGLTPAFAAPTGTVAPGAPISLDPSASTVAAGISSATWSFGDNTAGVFRTGAQALSPVSHSFAADGSYTVTLTLVDARGDEATVSHVVHVDEPPTAAFTVTPAGSGQSTAFDATSSSDPDGTITGYAWSFGDGTTGTGATPSHVYQTAGSYSVTLTVTDSDGDSATTTQTVAVAGPTPVFSISAAQEGTPVQFDGTGSGDTTGAQITSETWNFGDGTTQSGTLAPSHTYAVHGTYYVSLTLTDANGDTSSDTQQVVVADEPPTAAFTLITASPGSGQPTAFDATSSSDPDGTITGYAWSFGDGSTGAGATPSHTFSAPGTYTVTLTVTDSDGDTATTSQAVTVAGPLAQFTAPTTQLEGTALSFVAGSPGPGGAAPIAYAWSFGDGTTAAGATATHAYASAGTYQATLTLTDARGDTSTATRSVTVLDEPPTAAFSVLTATPSTQRAVAFDGGASTDADGTVTGYAWSFGDGTFATGLSPTHVYSAPGTYTVSLTVTDSGGQTSAAVSHQVVVYAPPQAGFAVSGNGAPAGSAVSFDAAASGDSGAGGPIVSYAWNFGDNTSAGGLIASHQYGGAGSFPVTLTVTNAVGLQSTLTQWVTVGLPSPVAVIHVLTRQAIAGQPVSVDAGASSAPVGRITGYAWSFGSSGSSADTVRASHTFAAAGSYAVTLTVTSSTGLRSSSHVVITVAAPGRITRVKATQTRSRPALLIVVDGPGVLTVAGHSFAERGAGSTVVQLHLTGAQLHALAADRVVTLRTTIAFAPRIGTITHRTLVISVKRPRHSRRYTVRVA